MRNHERKCCLSGFTLIEMLVVILIISILAAFAVPQYFKAAERSRAGDAFNFISSVSLSQERYVIKYGGYETLPAVAQLSNLDINFTSGSPQYGMKNFAVTAVGASPGPCNLGVGFAISLTRLTAAPADSVSPRYGAYVVSFDSCANPKLSCVEGAGGAAGACAADLL